MTKTIGVLGMGSIGRRHISNLAKIGCRTLGYDPLLPGCTKGISSLIQDSDAVVIASPTQLHYEHLVACADAGKPVFVEKPVADRWIDVNATMVGYNLRFHSCVKQAKEWIESDMIGEPLWANFTVGQYSSKKDYLNDGVILNWSHEIDLALHLLGPAKVKSCVAINKESLADIVLSHVNGSQSAIHLDYVTQPEVRQSIIVGTEATIIMDLVNRQAWLRGVTGQIWDQFEGRDSWDENYEEEMKAFIDRLDDKTTLGCTGTEGLAALRVCLDAKKQAQHDTGTVH